jgi:hypothetical protein
VSRAPRFATAATLAAIGGLHVAWGRGSSFPFATERELSDAVVGSDAVPSAGACYTVAAALFAASALVADAPIAPRRVSRLGRRVVGAVLAVRGVAGLLGRTDVLSPGSASARFRRLDRRYFSPLCLALAAGSQTG